MILTQTSFSQRPCTLANLPTTYLAKTAAIDFINWLWWKILIILFIQITGELTYVFQVRTFNKISIGYHSICLQNVLKLLNKA